ncbi:MAG: ribosome silencing factor [Treponema sp.]|nr:ribosome silencing factor [Treponema sp.]
MADTLLETDNLNDSAAALAALLQENNGQDVCLLDLRGISNWTDFFIIATATSKTHMDGLERHVRELCHKKDMDIRGSFRKNSEDEWRLLDLGHVIVHLMTAAAREFYDLERLWRQVSS